MFSSVRSPMSALFLVLVASGLGIAQSPEGIDAINQVTIRFKEPEPPAVNVQVERAAGLPVVATESHAAQLAASNDASTTSPRVPAVKRVQYEHAEVPGSIAPKYTLTKNPLDDLQKDLRLADLDADGLGGIFDELNEVMVTPQTDANPPANSGLSNQTQSSPLDSILGERAGQDSTKTLPQTPAGPIADAERHEDNSADDDAMNSLYRAGQGLRDDAYYQSLGMPKQVRRVNRGDLPMTMGNIFGDEDEYDPACVKRYCEQVWQCAGGRRQGAFGRSCRDLLRSRQLRKSQNCGYSAARNDFKCKKLTDQDHGFPSQAQGFGPYPGMSGPYFEGGEQGTMMMHDGQIIYLEPHNAVPYGTEAYDHVGETGELLQAPTPEAPLP